MKQVSRQWKKAVEKGSGKRQWDGGGGHNWSNFKDDIEADSTQPTHVDQLRAFRRGCRGGCGRERSGFRQRGSGDFRDKRGALVEAIIPLAITNKRLEKNQKTSERIMKMDKM